MIQIYHSVLQQFFLIIFCFQLKLGGLDHAVYMVDCINLYALPVMNIKVHVLLHFYRKQKKFHKAKLARQNVQFHRTPTTW